MSNKLITTLSILFCSGIALSQAEYKNFCKPLEDYGPREDEMELRHVCRTEMKKNCEEVTESGCLEVTELRCEVKLTTNCSMNWENKTIYECKNVTKTHCTTLWTVDANGEKVWAGNEDDCRDVTWEECSPIVKQVPMQVAKMNCQDYPVSYFDYENVTSQVMADTMDCGVEKVPVCTPITATKCDDVTYTRCQELPETVCTTVEIPVPSQSKLHKQWCLFDQEDNIDFDRQVRKITELINAEEPENEIVGDLDPIFTDYSELNYYEAASPLPIQKRQPRSTEAPANYLKRKNLKIRGRGARKSA